MNIRPEDIPWQYPSCINTNCKAATLCLRATAWQLLPADQTYTTIVNPQLVGNDESCAYFRSSEPVRFAKGFTGFQERMFPKQYDAFMKTCMARFGRTGYFSRRRGDTPIKPKDQLFIKEALKDAGVTEDLDFDKYEEDVNWSGD